MRSSSKGGLVYSTDAGRMCPECRRALAECVCKAKAAPAGDGVVRVSRETKGRGGKSVTLIRGLALDSVALALLGKQLRTAIARSVPAAKFWKRERLRTALGAY